MTPSRNVYGKNKGLTCRAPDCCEPAARKQLCVNHYAMRRYRLSRGLDPEDFTPRRKSNGEGHDSDRGYRIETRNGKLQGAHRHIMEEYIGRDLLSDETVHHKNGVRNDNRLENLELRCGFHPQGTSPEDLLPWAREILRRYG